MHRRRFVRALVLASPLPTILAQGKAQGKGKGRNKERGDDQGDDHVSVYFRREDYAAVQRYYAGPRDLPPGLRKKYYRTGTLPPGWKKKMQPFPPELVRALPPPPPDCERGYVDGVAIVYDRKTRIILDSIDLISAMAGH